MEEPLESNKDLEQKLYLKKENSKALKQLSRGLTSSAPSHSFACSADRYLLIFLTSCL